MRCPICLDEITPGNLFRFKFVDFYFCWCDWCWDYFTIDITDEGYCSDALMN